MLWPQCLSFSTIWEFYDLFLKELPLQFRLQLSVAGIMFYAKLKMANIFNSGLVSELLM